MSRYATPRRSGLIVTGLAIAGLCSVALGAASAAGGTGGCRVVSDPTPTRHTTCRGVNLRAADFSGRDLRYADFTGSSMQRANLSGADLTSARLPLANLTRANLAGVRAVGARMTAAGLTRANLTGADLTGARLNGTIMLTRANLTGARLTGANLGSAMLLNATVAGADLSGARLTNIAGAGLVGQPSALPVGWRVVQGRLAGPTANLWGASFTDADLSGIDLSGASMIYVSIGGNSTLRGTPMTGAATAGMSWSWNFSANGGNGGPDGGTVICPNGSVATPGYASGLPGAPSVGC